MNVPKSEALQAALVKVNPDYPPMARQLKVEGLVVVKAQIDEEGKVEGATTVSGNPILAQAATVAVKKWKFKPFTEGGKPRKAVTDLTFTFKL